MDSLVHFLPLTEANPRQPRPSSHSKLDKEKQPLINLVLVVIPGDSSRNEELIREESCVEESRSRIELFCSWIFPVRAPEEIMSTVGLVVGLLAGILAAVLLIVCCVRSIFRDKEVRTSRRSCCVFVGDSGLIPKGV